MPKVVIVGTTTWGTTLAIHLGRSNIPCTQLARSEEEASDLNRARENTRFLPGIPLPSLVHITHDLLDAFNGATMVIMAVPSQRFRDNICWVRDSLQGSPIILSATKGLELGSAHRMSQLLVEELPERFASRICALSGPNLALEIVNNKPSSTVVASQSTEAAKIAQSILMSSTFRVYTNDDVVGVELGGALKNIVALGCGISDGLGYGDNAKSAFITRGLAEITRLGVAAGANPLTFYGLAGLGDLVATCASRLSRNRLVGEKLANGASLQGILASMQNVAEGVYTTGAAIKMASEFGVDMPIAQATHQVLFEDLDLKRAIAELLGRPPKAE